MPDSNQPWEYSPLIPEPGDLAPMIGGPKAPRPELYPGFTPPDTDNPSWAQGPWTRFMDMHSGGSQKLAWDTIYIQAPRELAERVFQAKFDRNPNSVTCTCCGPDYSVSDGEPGDDLYNATGYNRNCLHLAKRSWDIETRGYAPDRYVEQQDPEKLKYSQREANHYKPLALYVASEDVKVVCADEITDEDRGTNLRQSGYVWMGD
jgi:hypothetical protein